MTEARREKVRIYMRERTEWLKSRGICTKCGSEPAREGKTLCWACAMNLADRRKVFYERRKEHSLCWKCGKPTNGETLCPECKKIVSVQRAQFWSKRKANHQCPKCGKQLPKDYDRVCCQRCRVKQTNNTLRSRQNRKAA